MHILIREELLQIKGGGWLLITGIVGGVVTFIIGIVDGFLRPLSCNK